MLKRSLYCFAILATAPSMAAQVAISPRTAEPADLVRFALQVANPSDSAVVFVRVEVPEALLILGIGSPTGWTVRQVAATDSSASAIEWSGGQLTRGGFQEFTFFTRLGANVRRTTLFFPVRLGRSDGSTRDWRPGGFGQAPEVEIRGSVGLTPGAAFTLAAAALGLAVLGISLALRRPR